jgi:signal transduction histidine kinase
LVRDAPRIADLAENASRIIQFGVLIALASVLVSRWARSSPVRRRLTAAVVVPGAVWAIRMGVDAPLNQWGWSLLIEDGSYTWLYYALSFTGFGLLLLVALAVLYVGLLRQRLARAGVADLVVELGASAGSQRLEEALRRSLGDPDAEVLFWREPGRWVGPDGAPAALPLDVNGARAVTVLAREGRQVAAIVHDPALRSEPALVEAAAAAASLALENERLQALTLAQLSEVRSSRARIVAAADGARRRIERDLHDGAQQRLVSLALALRRTRAQLCQATPVALEAQLEALDASMHQALAELRDLAHGIHPAALTEQGLAGALASLADDAPLPVEVSAVPSGRLPAAVEATAWFVASEAVANAAKHAAATRVSIAARIHGGELELEVDDDGVGGADMYRGSGLLGLRDRLEALDGSLTIESPAGAGTRLHARIPVRDHG